MQKHVYWLQVLAKHDPGLRVHPDVRTLDLASQVSESHLLDVVVISTPCVDVSSRGLGQAQLGQVRTRPPCGSSGIRRPSTDKATVCRSLPFSSQQLMRLGDMQTSEATCQPSSRRMCRAGGTGTGTMKRCVRNQTRSCGATEAGHDKDLSAGEMDAALSEAGG